MAVIHAAHRALQVNRRHGETRRRRLLELVARLRQRLVEAGLTPVGNLPFPAQSFRSEHWAPVPMLARRLLSVGVRALPTIGCMAFSANLTLLVTARHSIADVDVVDSSLLTLSAALRLTLACLLGPHEIGPPLPGRGCLRGGHSTTASGAPEVVCRNAGAGGDRTRRASRSSIAVPGVSELSLARSAALVSVRFNVVHHSTLRLPPELKRSVGDTETPSSPL